MRPFPIVRPRAWMTLAAVCLLAPIGARAEDPARDQVSIKIRPVVLFAGGQVRTTVRTPRDARNRGLRVIVEGTEYYASSDVQLDGVDSATTHQFIWKDLPGGPYRVDAIVVRVDGDTTTATDCFAVLSGDDGEAGGDAPALPTRRRQRPPPRVPDTLGVKTGC